MGRVVLLIAVLLVSPLSVAFERNNNALDDNKNYESSANEIRAIVSSPGVAMSVGDRPIKLIRKRAQGIYDLLAGDINVGDCEVKIQIGYERAVWPPEPSVHIKGVRCGHVQRESR